MTEIKIEKKKLKWPWVLLIVIILAALAYYLLFAGNKEEIAEAIEAPEFTEVVDQIGIKEDNVIVAAYVTFIDADKKMNLDHKYTNEALLKLTDATQAIAGELDYRIQGDLERVKEIAAFIKVNKLDTLHADSIRVATDIITGELRNIQLAKYPGLKNDITELSAASIAINPTVLTLDQKVEVKAFFRKAADLLLKMN
jgi:hypothetical protein